MRLHILTFAILLVVGGVRSAAAHDFTWRNLMLASAKLRPSFDAEANVDSYLQIYRADVWKRYHNDEFELAEKRRETIEIMERDIEQFKLDEDFTIRGNLQFGTYDFKTGRFPIAGISEDSYYYESQYSSGTFPSTFKVFFSNPTLLDGITMPEAEAKEFLRLRKDRYGDVNRRLYAKLNVRLHKLKSGDSELLGEIRSAKIYADGKYTKLIAEFAEKKE